MTISLRVEFAKDVERFFDEMEFLSPRYPPNRFKRMIKDRDNDYVAAVEELMIGKADASGFCELLSRDALHLVMENLVISPKYASLFSDKSIEMARWRLKYPKEYCETIKKHPQSQS